MANITGTNGDDTLNDTSGDDVIQGLGGDDRIVISGGNDNVDGGAGTDTLVVHWGASASTVRGNSSFLTDDHGLTVNYLGIEKFDVTTGSGADNFSLLDGDDTVSSGAGDDSFNTMKGSATVDGGAGNDLWAADFSLLTKAIVLDINKAGIQTFVGGSETNVERLSFIGGAGADKIMTLAGAAGEGLGDTLDGGGGDDVLGVGGGSDNVNGGEGIDTLVVDWSTSAHGVRGNDSFLTDDNGLSVNYAGIENFNVSTGAANDGFSLLDGDDTVSAGAGDDDFDTRKGQAKVDGGAGNDRWRADFSDLTKAIILDLNQAGTVKFAGGSEKNVEALAFTLGSGDDVVTTSIGLLLNDTLNGGGGNDILTVGGGVDAVDGGVGIGDILVVDFSASTHAIRGNDSFLTDDVSFTVNYLNIEKFNVTGGSAADGFYLGNGDDTVSAGAGNDSFDTLKGRATVDGGAGKDLWAADFSQIKAAMVVDLAQSGVQAFAGGQLTNVERLAFTLGVGDDVIMTLAGKAGAGLDDTLRGGGGDDTLGVGGGTDFVDGGGGGDTLVVQWATGTHAVRGNDSFLTDDVGLTVNYAGIEHFNVATGRVADRFSLGDGDDTVASGAGDDTFDTLKGRATVDGGAGVDTWAADFSDIKKTMVLNLNLGGTQVFRGGQETSVEALHISTGAKNDVITTLISVRTGETVSNLYDDIVNGGAGDDRITVGGGNDLVHGGAGTDTLVVDWRATGHAIRGNDSFLTDDNGFMVNYDGIEQFNVIGGSAADGFSLGNGDDTVSSGGGDDSFDTLKGNATVDGGAGVDLWKADFSKLGQAVVIDLNISGPQSFAGGQLNNVERIGFTTGKGDDVVVTRTGAGLVGYNDTISTGRGDDTITVGGGDDVVDGGAGFDTLFVDFSGTTHTVRHGEGFYTDDHGYSVVYTGIEKVVLSTGSSADKLTLGVGADQLFAGAGNDSIEGGGGDDTLAGGLGQDQLTGGSGADTFVFNSVSESTVAAADIIRDFGRADVIDLSGIDADTTRAGDQAFSFIHGQGFHHVAGELRAVNAGGMTVVSGDVDGDGVADFAITLDGSVALKAGDFVL